MDSRNATVLLILACFLATASATDIYLASLPGMASYFSSTADALQGTISVYLFAQVISAPTWGALSDHFNRQRILLAGMLIFLLGSILCASATTVSMLFGARFIQGMGAIAPYIVGWATISDLYTKEESAKVMSLMGGVATLVPLVAPMVGGELDDRFGWRVNFIIVIVLAVGALWLLKISKFNDKRVAGSQGKLALKDTLLGYKVVLKNIDFVCYVLIFAFLGAGEFAYLAIAPFYLESVINLRASQIGLFISLAAASYVVGALGASPIIKWIGTAAALKMGTIFCLLSALMLFAMHYLAPNSLLIFALSASLYLLGLAIVWGPSTSSALAQVSPRERGRASAVRSLLNTAAQALGAGLGSFLPESSIWPLGGVFFTASLCALISLSLARKK